MNKALLICPQKVSLYTSFYEMLKIVGFDVVALDSNIFIDKLSTSVLRLTKKLPRRYFEKQDFNVKKKINRQIIKAFDEIIPEVVFVYNSEMLLPDTCKYFASKSKIIFFLADNPFYTPVNKYFPHILKYAHVILSPDSFWIRQLNMLGLKNVYYFVPNVSDEYNILADNMNNDLREKEIIYFGTTYPTTWGYKKALLMSKFTKFDFALLGGKRWVEWFKIFPELQDAYEIAGFISTEDLNALYNQAILSPVDGNPGILNGFHIRVLESLKAGALPLIEARDDVSNRLFPTITKDLPLIKDYNEAEDVAKYFLKNEKERNELLEEMRAIVYNKYSNQATGNLLMNFINDQDKNQ